MKLPHCKNAIVWTLLASLIFSTWGCTTSEQITDLTSCKAREITVKTSDGQTYLLTSWRVDSSQNITGKGAQILPSDRHGKEYKAFSGTLQAGNITAVEQTVVDGGNTALVILASVAVAVTVGVLVWANTSFSLTPKR